MGSYAPPLILETPFEFSFATFALGIFALFPPPVVFTGWFFCWTRRVFHHYRRLDDLANVFILSAIQANYCLNDVREVRRNPGVRMVGEKSCFPGSSGIVSIESEPQRVSTHRPERRRPPPVDWPSAASFQPWLFAESTTACSSSAEGANPHSIAPPSKTCDFGEALVSFCKSFRNCCSSAQCGGCNAIVTRGICSGL